MSPWTPEQVERLSKIEGWFDPRILPFYAVIDAMQRRSLSGHLGEIGVHHGKSFLPLALMARGQGEEMAVAVDLFDRNRSGSGQGDKERVVEHAKALGVDPATVRSAIEAQRGGK